MAKTTTSNVRTHLSKSKKKLGRHSKKASPNKNSKNYKKSYRGQGR